MADRKTRNFLPTVFQTDTNEKFLSATVDQLISEPVLTNLYGYVGRKFAPTYKSTDSYIKESTTARQNYQLEASTVIKNDQGDVTFFSNYIDYLNKIKSYGGLIDNHDRLFASEYYTYNPQVSFDKLVNFGQYYWLPNGPDYLDISATGVELLKTYNVKRDATTGKFVFTDNGTEVSTVVLPRGGTYKFVIDSPGHPFWIQSELGTNGTVKATPNISSRTVFGVENNGTDQGTITFNIPSKKAQERFVAMQTVSTVQYTFPFAYSDIHNKTYGQFQQQFPQYSGLISQSEGKEGIFINQETLNNRGDEIWTAPNVVFANTSIVNGGVTGSTEVTLSANTNISTGLIISGQGIANGTTVVAVNGANVTLSSALTGNASGVYTFTSSGYDAGTLVPEDQRFNIWKMQFLDIGTGDPLLRLTQSKKVVIDQKVFVRYGLANANKEFYKDYDGFFHQMPLLSSLQDYLFAQDAERSDINATFKVVDYAGWKINVEQDIIGKKNYTSPNGIEFTSGLKIKFDTNVEPAEYANKEFYVEQVGDDAGIILVPVDELITPERYVEENYSSNPTGIFPEYVTINRSAKDRNAWARNNRWFHRDVISLVAKYKNVEAIFNQDQRAKRPIVQFSADLKLFNSGRIAKIPVDVIDHSITDAFTQIEGTTLTRAFGVDLVDNMRVVFANDSDILVKNKVYVLNYIQIEEDVFGNPTGTKYIKLTKAADGDVLVHDTVVVKQGQYKGQQWWFDGTDWIASQQKTLQFQEPLFDVFDSSFDNEAFAVKTGRSFGDYNKSDFQGTKIFGYLQSSAGVPDKVLGFPLSYRTFGTQGDIQFKNYFTSDTFSYYDVNGQLQTRQVDTGFLQKIISRSELRAKNTWEIVVEPSKQYQSIGYVYDGTSDVFAVDVVPEAQVSVPTLKVFLNYKNLTPDQWVLVSDQVRLTYSTKFTGDGITTEFQIPNTLNVTKGIIVLINGVPRRSAGLYNVSDHTIYFFTAPVDGDIIDIRTIFTPAIGDKIDILVYSKDTSAIGFYVPPENLDLNAQNVNLDTITLGQMRNHLVAQSVNSLELKGDVVGVSNLRDIELKSQGGTLLQHSSPLPYGEMFILDQQANFIDSLRYAQREYTKFKNKFLELSISLPGIDTTDPAASVDTIIAEINKAKNPEFSWFYSDMVPYGTLKTEINYTVFDPLRPDYELDSIFDDTALSQRAVLIYLNGQQLVKDRDYNFYQDRPAVKILVDLNVDDRIKIVEYPDTNGSYVPETPTKLGLWPKWYPEIFLDNTYRTPINVLRGHDGSVTPTFGDYRDSFLLELEKRIYNNIKVVDVGALTDIVKTLPGKFRKSTQPYSLNEMNQLVTRSFQSWVGNNRLDFSSNTTFDPNDLFTWNYSEFVDMVDGERLPGSWRACYYYFYDTVWPHLTPWEMLGFSSKPDWWEAYYGPAPYTRGNKLLWDDLEAGRIRQPNNTRINSFYARPGLSTIIPVDDSGNLVSPAEILTASYNASSGAASWAVGHMGPTEFAWRMSSDYPYAVQQALALAVPAKYFATLIDVNSFTKYNPTFNMSSLQGQTLNKSTKRHIRQEDIVFNGQAADVGVHRSAGYLNWIADYLISQGVNPNVKLTSMLKNFETNLAYKLAGFSDQNYLKVLAEQVSPSTTSDTIVIPNENFKFHLNKSSPILKLTYSAVIVEKTSNGYSVRGYDLNNPFFTVIPSQVNNNSVGIKVLNRSANIFKDYQNLKLTVPYGYQFTSHQQVVDFLISYERFLVSQGFVFNDDDQGVGELRNWKLSAKEFLYWIQQGWKVGSIIVLSPVANSLYAITENAISDGISDSQYGSRVLDQNFNLVKNVNYEVMRSANDFRVTITDPTSVVGFVEVDLVQFEHVLIFDNSTVFNDVIYRPELGNRQYRLKLVGQKTSNWDGSLYAPGFIYNDGMVDPWMQGKDYLQGDIVEYKNQYYTALQNVVASNEFQFSFWKVIPSTNIKAGLLPNFSTIAAEGKAFYNSYPSIDSNKQNVYSHGLIGYRSRQYLSDLGLTETTQIEFYKGFITQKGSPNAVNQMLQATFNNLTSGIDFFEEWAVRTGTYGAITVNPFVEAPLEEKQFGANPSMITFVNERNNNLGDALSVFNKSQLYKSTDQYNGNIALTRTENSDYNNDILTAGYVNIDDVDATLFDIADYAELSSQIDQIGSGYLIWVAKDKTRDWNVYRVTETNTQVSIVAKITEGIISFTFLAPHQLITDDIFFIKNFITGFDGVYRVLEVIDLNTVTVIFDGDTTDLDNGPLVGKGIYLVLNSMRFRFMEDSRIYGLSNPPNGWKEGDKIWIDEDASTTAVQGQPYETVNGTWKVYEKTRPWKLKQSLDKQDSEYSNISGFGTSVRLTPDGLAAVAGNPWQGDGVVSTFFKDFKGDLNEGTPVSTTVANVTSFGFAVDLATDLSNNIILAVGSPRSSANVGFVTIHTKFPNSATYEDSQIIRGNSNDEFGTSIAMNIDGNWLYIGAPGNNKVYLYGRRGDISRQKAVVSAAAVDTTITVPFVVEDETDTWGNSLVISAFSHTCTPGIEYEVTNPNWLGTKANITFTNDIQTTFSPYAASGADILIKQGPYYKLLDTKTGNANSRFGQALSSSYDGAQIAVGAPLDTVTVYETLGNTTITQNYIGAGAVYVYDRVIEAFTADGGTEFVTTSVIPDVHRVTVGGIETTAYTIESSQYFTTNVTLTLSGAITANAGQYITQSIPVTNTSNAVVYYTTANSVVVGNVTASTTVNVRPITRLPIVSNQANLKIGGNWFASNVNCVWANTTASLTYDTVSFTTAPTLGDIVYVETNQFTLLERLTGINSLEGGQAAIASNVYFGTSLTICSNNCAIYIGAPNYNNGTTYNTGAVWKFHNRGRLYGTNNGYTYNPVFTPGDSIRLDNYEVIVSARMMPTFLANGAPANLLTLSSNVRANVGQIVSQNLGSGYYANVTVLANTAGAGSQTITVGAYMTANTFNYGQSIPGANLVRVGSTVTSAYPMASLDSLIKDINDANLLGISAVNENNRLRLKSDSTVAKNLLRILSGRTQPGSVGVYQAADLIVFAFMQIIINPYDAPNEFFGSKVKLASNAYFLVIGSHRGTTKSTLTLDAHRDKVYPSAVRTSVDGTVNTKYYLLNRLSPTRTYSTTFDDDTTRFVDGITQSGSCYVYELYDDPRDEVESPGRYSFAQQLNPGNLDTGDQFGFDLDISTNYIIVGAPGDDTADIDGDLNTADNTGSIYIFENPNRTRGWNLIRYEDKKVDIDSVNRIFLYSQSSNRILQNLQFIDPAKGKILGQAEQEITYKTDYDPAIYNRGNNSSADINTSIYWNDRQIGQVWWNLNQVRYIDYEQSTMPYRSANWGRLFPGSVIEVCEWVESRVLPSQYVASGGEGIPKYADNSAYVEITFVDPITNIISSKYYFWVVGKTSVDPNNERRNIPIATVAELIANPKNQGISYAAVIHPSSVIFYNIGAYLSGQDTILHIDYQLDKNTNIIHSEYALIQKGNSIDQIPEMILEKFVDSLSGIDRRGSIVPDPKLTEEEKYGIGIRPRQSMFVDRIAAVNILVSYVNKIFEAKPIARQYDLTKLNLSADIPSSKSGAYKTTVDTEIELNYLDLGNYVEGDRVLVLNDTTQDNLWAIYEIDALKQWHIAQIQSYKTDLYWEYVDWFATKPDGTKYSLEDKLDYVVDTVVDAKKLPVQSGAEILVKVSVGVYGGWNLFVVNDALELILVGIENGTVQLDPGLGNFNINNQGFGNQGYDINRYDQNPDIEIRNIVRSLKDDIFVNELQGEFNNLFFVLINYLLGEQKYVDWLFKTSFINVKHKIRTLSQFPSFVQDNQTYYQSYIDEVKPYSTKIREYLLDYTGQDTYQSTVTDFDLPPYFDTTSRVFRSPSGEVATDDNLWLTYPYNYWYENRKYSIGSIEINDPGEGYVLTPEVTIVNPASGGTGATAIAFIDSDTGKLTRIQVTNGGSGYITPPTIIINGSSTVQAKAYAVLKNNQVRTFDTAMKFDRVSYTSSVKEWTANASYAKTLFDANGYVISGDIITNVELQGNTYVRQVYSVIANVTVGTLFDSTQFNLMQAGNLKGANDRIVGYYQPGPAMPERDLKQLVSGIEYPGVQIQGPSFNISNLFGSGEYDYGLYDSVTFDQEGKPMISDEALDTVLQSSYTDNLLGTRPEDINVDGGSYVDSYSSHAPEELVPGIMFDTLDMKVLTKINGNTETYGFRMFSNMVNEWNYLRISDNYATTLTQDFNAADGNIVVDDSSKLTIPDPTTGKPGVVFIGSERITYWTNNVAINTLGQIRRGTAGTALYPSYPVGTGVVEGGYIQQIPGMDTIDVKFIGLQFSGNISANVGEYISQPSTGAVFRVIDAAVNTSNVSLTYQGVFKANIGQGQANANVIVLFNPLTSVSTLTALYPVGLLPNVTLTRTVTTTPTVEIELTGNLRAGANVGSFITQVNTGANATVLAYKNELGSRVLVSYNNASRFDFSNVEIKLSGNIVANVGEYITQTTSGANLTVKSVTGANVIASYNTFGIVKTGFGNYLRVNGLQINLYPLTTSVSTNTNSNILVNGNYTSNLQAFTDGPIYPKYANVGGFVGVTDAGNVNVSTITTEVAVVKANTKLRQSNVWYNIGVGVATDGTGLEGAVTPTALFIKGFGSTDIGNLATLPFNTIVTEDGLDAIVTEDSKAIVIE